MSRANIAAAWWRASLADRTSGPARGLAARLRRAEGIAVLAEPAVQELARRLEMGPRDAASLILLAQVLAELRENDPASLARRLGGCDLSTLRFQRLMRMRGDEFADALRRMIIMADRRCNVALLAADLLVWDHPDWGDAARVRWCFDYFGAPLDSPVSEETPV